MGLPQTKVGIEYPDFDILDLSGLTSLSALNSSSCVSRQGDEKLVTLVPAHIVRARRFLVNMDMQRPFSNADLDQIVRTVEIEAQQDENQITLYRQPAAFLLDHRLVEKPPVGRAGKSLSIEFLNLSITRQSIGLIEKELQTTGQKADTYLTPHELLVHLIPDEEAHLVIWLGANDTIISAVSDNGLAGTGSIGAGLRHLLSDLVAAGIEDPDRAAEHLERALDCTDDTDDLVKDVVQARLREMAAFSLQVLSSSHLKEGARIYLIGVEGPLIAETFHEILGTEPYFYSVSESMMETAITNALLSERLTYNTDVDANSQNVKVWQWLRQHI